MAKDGLGRGNTHCICIKFFWMMVRSVYFGPCARVIGVKSLTENMVLVLVLVIFEICQCSILVSALVNLA